MMAFRNQMQQLVQEYERKKSAMKLRWLEEKKQYDANRMKKYLPSSWRNKPVGTQITQKVCNHYPETSNGHIVSNCLADVIDGVIIKLQSNAQDEPFKPFEGPQRPDPNILVVDRSTGETFAQRQQRHTVQMQKEVQSLTVKLAAAEEERKKAWKKLQKAKMEFEAPEFQMAARMQKGGSSRAQHTQRSSYMPNRSNSMRTAQGYAPTGQVNVSDTKYSSARVSDRVANDGSVAPVNKPKKTADGYYQRPTGRGRKGMTWDAVNGRWVPIA
jgi:hypothetical protein